MNKLVLIMGIIIGIGGFVPIIYSVRITTAPTETKTVWDKTILVSTGEVENMKTQGWVVGVGGHCDDPICNNPRYDLNNPLHTPLDKYNIKQRLEDELGLVTMTKVLKTETIEHYVEVYPYQMVGTIVVLIGFVTAVIGVSIPSVPEKT